VEPGALFVALAKTGRDCRGSISEAMRRGCGAVLLQHRDPEISVPACFVPDVQEAYGRLCHALAGNPSHRMKIIGVAGTGGRTTVSCLIASILNSTGQKIGILGRLGCLDGREVCSSIRSIPPAEDLADILARMVANGCSHAVLDVSGAALGKRRAEGVQFDAACVTGLRRNRSGRNDPLWNGQGTGPRVLDFLAPEGFVVINADDPGSVGCLSEIDGPVLTVGLRSAAEITARVVEHGVGGQVFLLAAGSETIPVRTSMVGARHVRHCLMAAAVGLAYGIEIVKIVQGLEAVNYVPGRLQRIDCGQPFGVFIDDARTPHALAAALRALRPVTSGRLMCVFSTGESDPSLCSRMGRVAERFADLCTITGESRRIPISGTVLRDILSGFRRPAAVEIMPERAGAIGWALSNATEGDVVLFAGQRRPRQPDAEGKRPVLDDCELVRKWLHKHQRAEV
jgi:UDP-N-acetylmuramoyl-L-alanyl-D-glutamate--2,6-diaminopimelate ligase